jgi:hypothetical protein
MIDISLFIPSRKRTALLKKCIDSFFLKAHDVSKIEMIILMDFDDTSLDEILAFVRNRTWNITIAAKNRSIYLIRDYQNPLGRMCAGKYCWGVNDECEVVQDKWDNIFRDNIPDFEDDKLRYIKMDDDGHHPDFCCFPAISRKAMLGLDGYMPQEKLNWGADVVLHNIFERISQQKLLPYDPIVDISTFLKVNHYSSHNKKTERDEIYQDIKRYNIGYTQPMSDDDIVGLYVNKLVKFETQEEKHYHYHFNNSIVRVR